MVSKMVGTVVCRGNVRVTTVRKSAEPAKTERVKGARTDR